MIFSDTEKVEGTFESYNQMTEFVSCIFAFILIKRIIKFLFSDQKICAASVKLNLKLLTGFLLHASLQVHF